MKTRNEHYNALIKLLDKYDEKIKIHRDISDGVYLNKINMKNNGNLNSLDSIASDGNISYDAKSSTVEDSSFVIIKTYENGVKYPELSNITIIITNEGFGYLQAILLSNAEYEIFNKLMQKNGMVKGSLEDFTIRDTEGSYTIVPDLAKKNKSLVRKDI